jgi:hypothetical protein
MLSAAQAKTWKFLELWVDPVLFPPKVLMLIGDADGSCRIFNPAADTNSSSPTPTTKPPKIGYSKTNTIGFKANSSPKKFCKPPRFCHITDIAQAPKARDRWHY